MKKHHFGILLSAAVVALLAVFWSSKIREPEINDGMLLPGQQDLINEVVAIKLIGGGNQVIATLTRGETSWKLAEKSGYRANSSEIRKLLLTLAQSKLLEEKTSNPEYYSKLGVEDIASEDAAGIRVELKGIDVQALIIGEQDATRDAFYVRKANEATSWLASGVLAIPSDTAQWFDHEIVRINPARLAEVEIKHADGTGLVLSKRAFGQADFDVSEIPAGRHLQRPDIANSVASVIEDLDADDVMREEQSGFTDLAVSTASFRTFDGLVLEISSSEAGDKRLAKIRATTDADLAARYLTSKDPEEDGVAGDALPTPDLSAVSAEADKLNDAFSGWVYELSLQDFRQLNRRISDLLQEED